MRRVFTVGHSTRSLEELIRILKRYKIEKVIDVRRWPKSKKNPQFEGASLKAALEAAGVEYVWLGELLGGYRRPNYKEYMKTEDFKRGIDELETHIAEARSAILCAERFWFRCHRRFISDVLAERGWEVVHIIEEGKEYVKRRSGRGERLV